MINSCFYRYVARKYNYYKCVSLIFFERLRPVRSRKGHMTKSKQSSECFKVTAETKKVCLSRVENSERTGTANHTCADLQGNRSLSVLFARVCVCANVWVKS